MKNIIKRFLALTISINLVYIPSTFATDKSIVRAAGSQLEASQASFLKRLAETKDLSFYDQNKRSVSVGELANLDHSTFYVSKTDTNYALRYSTQLANDTIKLTVAVYDKSFNYAGIAQTVDLLNPRLDAKQNQIVTELALKSIQTEIEKKFASIPKDHQKRSVANLSTGELGNVLILTGFSLVCVMAFNNIILKSVLPNRIFLIQLGISLTFVAIGLGAKAIDSMR